MEPLMAGILLLGLVLGIIYKTYIPFRSKMKAGKIKEFDTSYIWTAVVALVSATLTALTMFDAAAVSWVNGWPFGTGYAAVAFFGFLWAVGWNYGANRFLDSKAPKGKVN